MAPAYIVVSGKDISLKVVKCISPDRGLQEKTGIPVLSMDGGELKVYSLNTSGMPVHWLPISLGGLMPCIPVVTA